MSIQQYVIQACEGKRQCDTDSTLPQWWIHVDNHSVCVDFSGDGEHYFMGVRVDFTCEGEFVVQEYNLTVSTLTWSPEQSNILNQTDYDIA